MNVPSPISRFGRRKKEITKSLDAVFPETAFTPLLQKRILPLVELAQEVLPGDNGSCIPKRLISAIEDTAHDVETFLDDYDARSNRTFATIAEFVACARGFAELDHTIQHVVSRFASYHPGKPSSLDEAFRREAAVTLEFADRSLRKLLEAVIAEIAAISKRRPARRKRARKAPPERLPRFRLPHDIDELAALNDDQKIAELASLFLAHKHTLDKLSDCKPFDDVEEMRRYVLDVSDEEQCRYFQTKIHNLQSKYDTLVKSTDAEKRDPELKRFRGFVSTTLHLIECMTHLVHFYERHENDIRAEQVKDRVAALVDKDRVLDRALNFCLFFAHSYLNVGATLAERLVKRYTSQSRIVLELPEGIVLHIRPASLIAEIVKHHGTPVKVTIGNETKYAGSVLDILMTAGSNTSERKLVFEGDLRPLEDLRSLFAHRLGEAGFDSFPPQLAYLRPGS